KAQHRRPPLAATRNAKLALPSHRNWPLLTSGSLLFVLLLILLLRRGRAACQAALPRQKPIAQLQPVVTPILLDSVLPMLLSARIAILLIEEVINTEGD